MLCWLNKYCGLFGLFIILMRLVKKLQQWKDTQVLLSRICWKNIVEDISMRVVEDISMRIVEDTSKCIVEDISGTLLSICYFKK